MDYKILVQTGFYICMTIGSFFFVVTLILGCCNVLKFKDFFNGLAGSIMFILFSFGLIFIPYNKLDSYQPPEYSEVAVGKNKIMIEADNMTLILNVNDFKHGVIKIKHRYNCWNEPLWCDIAIIDMDNLRKYVLK